MRKFSIFVARGGHSVETLASSRPKHLSANDED